MRPLSRRGFTLAEVLIGVVVLAIFGTVLVAVVRSTGQVASRTTAALLADRAVIQLQLFIEQEMRDATTSDVALLAPARLGMQRPIGEAVPCDDAGGALLVPDTAWAGTRTPEGGRDDVWLLLDPVAEAWLRLAVDSVGRARCPVTGAAAMRLSVAPHAARAQFVRVMEPVELSAYRSGATDWFGLTPASHAAAVQPFAGPLQPGVARFALVGTHLDAVVPPAGARPVAVVAPLGSPP